MKKIITFLGGLNGKIVLPSSKSISNRALILNALSGSESEVVNLSDCDDTNVMLAAFSSGKNEINIGAAGTSMRFLTAFLAQKEGCWTITGSERMKNRPIRILVDALRQLGADIVYLEKEGFPPLKINGKKLRGGKICLDGSVSSQYISALMMIAPVMADGLNLTLTGDIISKPYIRMTSQMMKDFGVYVNWDANTIEIKPQIYNSCTYTVEADWSAASYWYEMVALSKESADVELVGLFQNSLQGDSKVSELFFRLGVETQYTDRGVKLYKNNSINQHSRFEYDFVNEPDLAQTFVVTCAMKNIPFSFTGLQSLRIKETDRMLALQTEMKKLGYIIRDTFDSVLEWDGERCEPDSEISINTYEDHRMAMAFTPVAIVLKKININDPSVVSKSYPGFWKDLESVGFHNIDKN